MMIGPEDTETDRLDKRDREVYLSSTATTVGPEQELAPSADLGAKPRVPSKSQISRMSVKSREQEMPKEMAASMIMKGTSHEASDVMEETMTRQIWGTYSKWYGTGENYTTQELDHTSFWKDAWRKVGMSHDDPETIDAPTHTPRAMTAT